MGTQKQVGAAILFSDKAGIKTKLLRGEKRSQHTGSNSAAQQLHRRITIVNIYAPLMDTLNRTNTAGHKRSHILTPL